MNQDAARGMPDPSASHLSAGAAVDAGRDVIPLTSHLPLERHVDACPSCRAKVNAWKAFSAMAQREAHVSPPAAAVARVLDLAKARRPVSGLTRIKAALRYDGAWTPVPVGVRGPSLPDQVVYEAEGVAVDLRVSHDPARKVVIVGQLAHAGAPDRRLADLPVLLLDGDDVKVRALSNEWGEFHLEHPRRSRLRLEVGLPGGRVIRIPLSSRRKRS